MEINKYNFLRWNDDQPEPGLPDVPAAYRKDRGHYGYLPVMYPSETTSFYINSDSGVLYNFADLRLGLVLAHTGQMVATNIGALEQHFIDNTNTPYNIHCTFTNPAANDGVYYLAIYQESDNTVILSSNYMLVRNDKANLDHETMFCRFRHDRFFYGIKYHELPGFYQQFRLHISQLERQPEIDRQAYKEATTGAVRVYHSTINRYYKFETYYFDAPAHEAATVMIEHNDVEFNGKVFTIKTPYREPANVQSILGKGEFEMYDDAFARVNRC